MNHDVHPEVEQAGIEVEQAGIEDSGNNELSRNMVDGGMHQVKTERDHTETLDGHPSDDFIMDQDASEEFNATAATALSVLPQVAPPSSRAASVTPEEVTRASLEAFGLSSADPDEDVVMLATLLKQVGKLKPKKKGSRKSARIG